MRETRPTVDSYFVLVKTYQHGIAFQPQAMKLQGRVQRSALRHHVDIMCACGQQLSTVAPVTCFVVTREKTVVRVRVGSGQTVDS